MYILSLFRLVALSGLLLVAALAHAEPVAPILDVQGTLASDGGAPVAEGKYTLTFRLYADLKDAEAVWKEIHIDVPVKAGLFRTQLGLEDSKQPIPSDLFAKHGAVAIGLQVSTDPELPRVRLVAVPYALHAQSAESALIAANADEAKHAATADALSKPLTGDLLVPGSLPAAAVGFTYAGSSTKGGDALGLTCTGCITKDHLAPDALSAANVSYAGTGGATTVQDEIAKLLKLLDTIHVAGVKVGLGKIPADACALDVASAGGQTCIDGVPALWTRVVADDAGLASLTADGTLVYRKDKPGALMLVAGKWREIQFKTACGDGVVELLEECDDGANNANVADKCRTNCKKPACGDGIADTGEACDDGNVTTTDGCVGCQVAKCGDGFVYLGVEECDDNNGSNTDACVSGCKKAGCGDGFVQAGVEDCDDGAANGQPGKCPSKCKVAKCGDGTVDAGEGCDDGNTTSGDGCPADCCASGWFYKGLCLRASLVNSSADSVPNGCVPHQPVLTWGQTEYLDICNHFSAAFSISVSCASVDTDADGGLCTNYQALVAWESIVGNSPDIWLHDNAFNWNPKTSSNCTLVANTPGIVTYACK